MRVASGDAPGTVGERITMRAAGSFRGDAGGAASACQRPIVRLHEARAARAANVSAYLLADAPGDAQAWKDAEVALSYANLRFAVAGMVERLRSLDLRRGTPVALVASNGTFWIASYLAIMASGLVVVPLPSGLRTDDLVSRSLWARCGALLAGRDRTAESRAVRAAGIPVLDEHDPASAWMLGEASTIPWVEVSPGEDAAYLFTSGTSGTPRAVRITHRNIRANTESILAYLDLHRDDRMLVVLPFTYVFGASLLHTHLRVGATLVDHPTVAYPETVVAALAEEECTGLAGVPSLFNLLIRNSSFARRRLPALRTVQQAGGNLSPSVLHELMEAQPQAQVFVMYGQTEATARLSYLPPSEILRRPGSIGRGIPGVRLRVVGMDGADVSPGEIGEILATGENVSPGYLRDSDATERRMDGGVLRTGDLATVDSDGFVYIVDRSEDFIKSWGHRIASTDIEAAAMQLPSLVAAAAVGMPDERSGERVELVVVARQGPAVTERDVLVHCRRVLPRFMMPARVHIVDALAANANGKVLKRLVRQLCTERATPGPSRAPS